MASTSSQSSDGISVSKLKYIALACSLSVFVGLWILVGVRSLQEWDDKKNTVFSYAMGTGVGVAFPLGIAVVLGEGDSFRILCHLPPAFVGLFAGWILSIVCSGYTNNNIQTLTGIATGLVLEFITRAFGRVVECMQPVKYREPVGEL